jgi:shikimate kinase/3-dehydroquinate synthase
LFLFGPMGCGKTSVGKLIAERLDWPFLDTDEWIEADTGMPVAEIFHQEGEVGFRMRERKLIADLVRGSRQVISLGGGTLVDPENRALAESSGPVVMLACEPEEILRRLGDELLARPLLVGPGPLERLQAVLAKRAELYASFPDTIDTTGIAVEDVARKAMLLAGVFHVRGMGGGYDVLIGHGLLPHLAGDMEARKLAAPFTVVTDSNVAPLYLQSVLDSLARFSPLTSIVIDAGESSKNLRTVESLYDRLCAAGMERRGTIVALGGGVVSDLAGFAAATYLRGVAWVALPTTLIGMVDAAIGGKTAVDLPQGKNLVGAFHPPSVVIADLDSLATLPPSELRAGMAETVKTALVGDSKLLAMIESMHSRLDPAGLDTIVRRAARVKIRVVEEDPFERHGPREALNLGHTIGHAIESHSNYGIPHGEAVGLGLIAESALAEILQLADPGLSARVAGLLGELGLPVRCDAPADDILPRIGTDKKRRGGRVRWALPISPGKVRIGLEVPDEDVRRAVESLRDAGREKIPC